MVTSGKLHCNLQGKGLLVPRETPSKQRRRRYLEELLRTTCLAMMSTTLMATPRSPHDLWQEYHHGVGGRKAARLFSYTERGHSKHRYSRRKVVWDLVSRLVWMGDTAETAIDKIYAVYGGQTSVTNIINGLKRDRKDGTLNPNFRI